MTNNKNVFGKYSNSSFTNSMCKLITQKTFSLLQYYTAQYKDFHKILNPYANPNILNNLSIKVFDDMSEEGLINGFDRLIDAILREHLFYYKIKAINLSKSAFGDFSEEAIGNAITQIIDTRISESFFSENNNIKNQSTYSSIANQYVYILYNEILYKEYNTHIYKIGWTTRTPQIRADEISQGTGVVGKWLVGHQWKVEDGYWLEQRIFQHFAQYRLPYSEQFNFKGQTLEQVAEQISRFIHNHGESPKHAAEIAKIQKQHELNLAESIYKKQLRKIEEEKFYDTECDRVKEEISNKIQLLIEGEMKPILEKKEQINRWYYIVIGIIVIPWSIEDSDFWISGLIGGFFLTFISGFILSKIFENKTHEITIKEKYSKYQILPNDLEKLKKIKKEIFQK